MEKEKVLIVSPLPACDNLTGALFTSHIIKFFCDENIDVHNYSIVNFDLLFNINQFLKDNIKYNTRYFNTDNLRERTYKNKVKKEAKELVKYMDKHGFTKVICISQGEIITDIINYAQQISSFEYYVQVWDTLEWWMDEYKYSENKKIAARQNFEQLMENASGYIASSRQLKEEWESKYNNPVTYLISPVKYHYKRINNQNKKTLRIAMAGQIYANKELDALFDVLDKMNWEYNGQKIYFHHYGVFDSKYIDFKKHRKYKSRIILEGILSQEELRNKLLEHDYLYCPYFFSKDKNKIDVVKYSFPGKLTTYLSLEVPCIIHAPSYSSIYKEMKSNNSSFVINSIKNDEIKEQLIEIFKTDKKVKNDVILNNAQKYFNKECTVKANKKRLFDLLDYKVEEKEYDVLEINNEDIYGRKFNGYDLLDYINKNTNHSAYQLVLQKLSKHNKVVKIFKNSISLNIFYSLVALEREKLSSQNMISLTEYFIKNNMAYQQADLVHFHLIHNMNMDLHEYNKLTSEKPAVVTLHDQWFETGRCVWTQECNEYLTGCKKCKYLNTLFPLKEDTCSELWKVKQSAYSNLDVDYIVTTPYMLEEFNKTPLIKNKENIHVVPFGIELSDYDFDITKDEARKKLKISSKKDEIVIFLRAQLAAKGTEYVLEAMKMLETDKSITLLTCSETGLLDEVKDKYKVIDLGNIDQKKLKLCYNACDFFLMPSKSESFGLMAIEAMASGKAIIVFDNTALPHVTFAPECGVLVENKNSKELCKAIKWMIDDEKERIRRGKLGKKLTKEHYDINIYHQKLLEVYNKAYQRQKQKLEKVTQSQSNDIVNYNSKEIQYLIKILVEIYIEIFNEVPIDIKFYKYYKKKVKKVSIKYSDKNIQNVFKIFNQYVYNKLQRTTEHAGFIGSHNKNKIQIKNKYILALKEKGIVHCAKKVIEKSGRKLKLIRRK